MQGNVNIEQLAELEIQVDNLSRLVEINGIINSTLNINKLLSIIMEMIKNIMNAEASSLLLYDEESSELVFKVALGEAGEELKEKYRVKIGQGIAGHVAETRKSLVVNDVYSDSRFDSMFDESTGFVTRSIICAPLLFKGKLLGVIQAINPVGRSGFNDNDENLFRLFSNQAALAVQNAMFFQRAIEEERIESELSSAREIQVSLSPDLDIEENDLSFSGKTIFAREMGGGFHLFKDYVNGSCFFALGAIGEKGVPGAMKAVAVSAVINSLVEMDGMNLSEVIQNIKKIFQENLHPRGNFSTFIGHIDQDRSQLNFINAGKACLLLLRDNEVRYLRFSKKSRGYICDADFYAETVRVGLKKGDRLVVFSETMLELKNKNGKPCSLSKIVRFIENNNGNSGEIVELLTGFMDDYTGGYEKNKDVSILAVEV